MSNLESIVSRNLAELLDVDVGRIALDADLSAEYGLTSLNLVLLMTSLCEETGTSLFNFTDKA
jgi:acyl carrier protein